VLSAIADDLISLFFSYSCAGLQAALLRRNLKMSLPIAVYVPFIVVRKKNSTNLLYWAYKISRIYVNLLKALRALISLRLLQTLMEFYWFSGAPSEGRVW